MSPTLFDFQREGVEWLTQTKRAILADELGLGKTIQAIVATDRFVPKTGRCLIVSPSIVIPNWVHEIRKWAPERSVVQLDGDVGSVKEREKTLLGTKQGYAVINYEALRMMEKASESTWDAVVFDEAHRLKNRKTKTFKTLRRLSYRSEGLLELTGTPIMTEPGDLWPLLYMIDRKTYSSYWRFVETYAYVTQSIWGWEVQGLKDAEGLRQELSPLLLRREKRDVLPDLPPKIIEEVRLGLGKRQALEYARMRDQMKARLLSGEDLHASILLAQLTRLRQIAVDIALLDETPTPLEGPKAQYVINLVQQGSGPIVVFSQFAKALQRLKWALRNADIRVGAITGSAGDRDKTLRAWRAGELEVLCLTTSLGEGITLVEGSTAVFLDRMWTPARNLQAQDRLHRPGQTETVTILNLLSSGTIEETIEASLLRKEKTFKEILAPENLVDCLS